MRRERILLIDSYDSFTFNLARLLSNAIPTVSIEIIKNDASFPHDISSFAAIIVGPGPGTPSNPFDVGIIERIWSLPQPIPVFGVCLGLQCLVLHFGGALMPLEVVKHGQVSILQHTGTDLFEGVNEIRAVRYHSLHVRPPSTSDVIVPLAWADDGSENGGLVLMAAKHKEKPFWGVQYHPESICSSSDAGIQVVRNFWKMAQEWNERSRSRLDLLSEYLGPSVPSFVTPLVPTPSPAPKYSVNTVTISSMSTALTITRICELLGFQSPSSEHLLLDSASAPAMGRFSVIGVVDETTPRITYSVGHTSVAIGDGQFQLDGKSIWKWLAEYMSQNQAVGGAEDSPFWGGLVGYFTYEVGVASLDIPIPRERGTKPDVALAFIHRSLVIDHVQHTIYLQSLLPDDESWLQNTSRLLTLAGDPAFTPSPSPPPSTDDALPQSTYPSPKITMPNKDGYIAAIKRAQSYLAQGESYELCLTALTKITFDTSSQLKSDWQLFKTLRQRNPAPFSAFLRLGGNTLIGSSPERFLSWTRSGHCQLRPIKGTVKKSPDMTFERAKELLYVPKEIAENLMIVDLIRHDLHQVAGDSVKVSKLFEVEEYETVFQLVSVIEGQVDQEKGFTGFDVLSRSLPPGSMTGAPKKRSVELLQTLEQNCCRGLYSGVCGYWCAGGGGDFSVIIRSAFRDGRERDGSWYLGAGGAVTALSDPEEEWDEMETKLKSTLQGFV